MHVTFCSEAESSVRAARAALERFSRDDELREAVERTVESVGEIRKFVTAAQHVVQGAAEMLESCTPVHPIDPDDRIASSIEKAQDAIMSLIEAMERKRAAAFSDPELAGQDERRVLESYSNAIEALKRLHEAAERLRWAVMNHDARVSPVSEPFGSVDELIADLNR